MVSGMTGRNNGKNLIWKEKTKENGAEPCIPMTNSNYQRARLKT